MRLCVSVCSCAEVYVCVCVLSVSCQPSNVSVVCRVRFGVWVFNGCMLK